MNKENENQLLIANNRFVTRQVMNTLYVYCLRVTSQLMILQKYGIDKLKGLKENLISSENIYEKFEVYENLQFIRYYLVSDFC